MDRRTEPAGRGPAAQGGRGGAGALPVVVPVVRERGPEDLPALLALLRRTHEQQGYPVRASAVSASWLAPPDELAAAVALTGRRVVGHVALHPADGPDDGPDGAAALRVWRAATGRDPDGLAVVSRLFTDGSVPGCGSLLLARATRRAAELGRAAVLLVDPEGPALAFYRRRGWRKVGTAVQHWGHRTVDAVLMTAP